MYRHANWQVSGMSDIRTGPVRRLDNPDTYTPRGMQEHSFTSALKIQQ
jgi:hypothetical protein